MRNSRPDRNYGNAALLDRGMSGIADRSYFTLRYLSLQEKAGYVETRTLAPLETIELFAE